ncbi:metallophosphoesterase family protein [Hymenobacter chitinivorans]|uniref:Calcineurin-like phosphoesterase family protein n=1 Tax=Hymenobacter chitinivorans DSM 11115 TaxID=1121954 RepID=A0A2M9B4H2_9BACT|nr:metallophosphoesterase [Hymenobacter chitinivorans]PJJ52834.1 calcineurin-like phosphoesterase family protein [Hymenobacter chitinivorans DSM 11115]
MFRALRFRPTSSLLLVAAALGLGSCDLLEFSPNDYRAPADERQLTEKNLARLQQTPLPAGDTLRFVFTGDSQRFYDEADGLVESVNKQPGINFMVVAGDISDFGFSKEMRWVNEKLRKLKVPYVTVIGNHDSVGNGREAYKEIFGPLNYSFIYGDTKFIMVDTNGREYNFDGHIPDMPWLNQQVGNLQGARRQVVISHVPPQDEDFDPAVSAPYAQALREAKNLVFEMNGHRHSSSITQPFKDGVWYVNSDAFSERQYMVVSVWGDKQFRVKQIKF